MDNRLKLFVAIVEAGSFTRAAQQLRVSQPALSASMQKLERELGNRLLERRSFALTEAGALAYQTGRNLLAAEHNLQTALAELAGRKAQLRLGVIDSLAEILFVHGNTYENIAESTLLSLTIDSSSGLVRRLKGGELDMAFVVAGLDYPAGIVVHHKLGDEPLMLVASHAQQAAISEASQTGVLSNFLSYNQGSRTQELVRRAAAAGGLALDTNLYATSPTIMLAMAMAGHGVAALPYHLVAAPIQSGRLLPIALNGSYVVPRPLVAVAAHGRDLAPAASVLIAAANRSLRNLTAQANRLSAEHTLL